MVNISVDFGKETGIIKPMHAVGQPPFLGGFCKLDVSPIRFFKEANIPYSRLHDVGGPFGGNRFVDIPNIFRDFDADVDDPASYDFAFTDVLLEGMHEYGISPIFRLGVTIENQCNIRAYRIHPPKDYNKWARICEHIVRHYNEGWADGYHYDIKYWEIWNEPENRPTPDMNQMWTGTAEQYYELYDVTSKHLKKCFGDTIKVGGYAATGFYHIFAEPEKYGMDIEKRSGERYEDEKCVYRMKFLYGFFDYIKEHNSPIDFFSWHSYIDAEGTGIIAEFVDKFLKERGYGEIETMLNEWNNAARVKGTLGTSFAAAQAAAMLLVMQNKPTSMLCYYDTRMMVSVYQGMFDGYKMGPRPLFYVFKAFGYMYQLGKQAECELNEKDVYAVAATDGNKKALMVTNVSDEDKEISVNLGDDFEVYMIDEENTLTKTYLNPKKFLLKSNQTVLVRN